LFLVLTKRKRETRVLAVYEFRVFVDDSGNYPREPWFVLAAWVGTVPEWEYFAQDWVGALEAEKPIKYFKHNEAGSQPHKGCFKGFSDDEVSAKVGQLLDVILKHNVYGVVSAMKHQDHIEVVQGGMPKPKGRLHRYFKDPLYLLFQDIIPVVLQLHLDKGFDGKVDFIFDGAKTKRSGTTSHCIDIYEHVKEEFRKRKHSFYELMGTVIPGDDKELRPLQAADFLAGQIRLSKIHDDDMPPPLTAITRKRGIVYHGTHSGIPKGQYS
jgi:uncharacterized protein DUF3800